ncbi:hypothetical protein A33O_14946 [Nitratireductor aquibiodomus RA22]|uniref:Uncharacterized protein n=1 Tax=Nitratireductor aquibiodomus RA22 TaxID=1189611 RepID=I5BV94_9HYPH|nr:hypothetical protein [Nitratireductor aquibiodomus]EIM73496.1 hypothetical protein A33O_14946 [Nitratireductor aquibiodomus RA22]
MTLPSQYPNHHVPIKYFLASYRALSDGRTGVRLLEEKLDKSSRSLLSEWKVLWIGTCTILRTSIDLFRIDGESCLAPRIREEIQAEWHAIRTEKEKHAIFWEFLRKERDSVIHQYEWRAYETWIKPDGTFRGPKLSLLIMEDDDGAKPAILMKEGLFKGRDSLELLRDGADWVEERIFSAVRRAGFDPEEARSLASFLPLPKIKGGLLGDLSSGDGDVEKDNKP